MTTSQAKRAAPFKMQVSSVPREDGVTLRSDLPPV